MLDTHCGPLISARSLRCTPIFKPQLRSRPRRHRAWPPARCSATFALWRYVTEGGMGEIYEAEQLHLSKRRVALKVIRRGKVSPDARARFLREQEVLAKLHQTNIVPVFAAGERDELQYFAMQYIDGATLGHVVKWLARATVAGPDRAKRRAWRIWCKVRPARNPILRPRPPVVLRLLPS